MLKRLNILSLIALSFTALNAHAIDIDLSKSSAALGNQKIMLKQVIVPGMGTYDAEFTWNGAGAFVLSTATPSPITSTPNLGRTCRLTMSVGYADITVASTVLDVVVYSNSNTMLFAPHYFSIKQGSNSSQMVGGTPLSGYTFLWTNPDGFLGGAIPAGTQKTGQVTWSNAWFQPTAPVSVINGITGESVNC